jgi:hypothetical protein
MSHQASALYGDLVLFLRDRAAEMLAGSEGDVEVQRERLDAIIRDWFFVPQKELYGFAPRDVIWAEQKGEPNPFPADRLKDVFPDDDCPVCQFTLQEIEAALERGEDPGFHWYYDDGGYPLIAHYDPEGWDERWADEDLSMDMEEEIASPTEEASTPPTAPPYDPPPIAEAELSPEAFAARLRQPWLDPALHEAARTLTARVDCPEPSMSGLRYRRLTYDEALSLAAGLHSRGVDVATLLTQIDAFPYENVALNWLSHPERNVARIIQAMEEEISPDDEQGQERFRHHRDFILALSEVVHPAARLWLQGWLDAVAHSAFTPAAGRDEEDSDNVLW